jgi:hypothetical protein
LRQVDGGLRMLGYIGANELEHALSIVADEADALVTFHTTSAYDHAVYATASISSFADDDATANEGVVEQDPFDFSIYMDEAPLTVQHNSPLELLHEFFTKLGARYVVVTDPDGYCELVFFCTLFLPSWVCVDLIFFLFPRAQTRVLSTRKPGWRSSAPSERNINKLEFTMKGVITLQKTHMRSYSSFTFQHFF